MTVELLLQDPHKIGLEGKLNAVRKEEGLEY